ncbi:MAG: 2-amino-4-hydroxy-6-hydroxymethyldihydropteridine diphosphokinase [Phycisphaerae bacterium]|nr:2-amino-4-hydroxy-6-hydroxymethyldihydropteridine diphosphokinase [Phycisphaerae bacterium]
MPEHAFVALGSNVAAERNLPLAIAELAALGRIASISQVYETAPIGPAGQPTFLNAAALLLTDLAPHVLRDRLREIEARLGRARTPDKYAPRTIDLDICLHGNTILDSDELTLPAAEIVSRAYLATTLAELAPAFRHPTTGETLAEIADRLRGQGHLIPRPDIREQIDLAIGASDRGP